MWKVDKASPKPGPGSGMQDIGVRNARAAEGVPERSVQLGCSVCVGCVIPRALQREH